MITRKDANTALKDVKQVMDRTSLAMGYKAASPHLLLWGVIWFLGYGAMAAELFSSSGHWIVLVAAGTAGSTIIGIRENRRAESPADWRPLATVGAIFLFIIALFTVLPPRTGLQIGTFFPLLSALAYIVIAIWTSTVRIGLTGMAVGVLSLYAFHFQPAYFNLLMTVIGSAALILGGLWMRRL